MVLKAGETSDVLVVELAPPLSELASAKRLPSME